MKPELEAIVQAHPSNQTYWKELDYDSIIPHENAIATDDELIQAVLERYGPDMNWYDRKIFPYLIRLAHKINERSRSRHARVGSAPFESSVRIETGVRKDGAPKTEPIDLTPWMEELASYDPARREVKLYTNGEYKRNQPGLLTTLVQSVDSSTLFAKGFAFNSLFNCVRVDSSPTIHKYRNLPDSDLRSSIAVVFPQGFVKVIQRRKEGGLDWDSLRHRLIDIPDEDTFTLKELAEMRDLCVQHVIDCSGESERQGIPPYCLSPTAHSGFSVNMDEGRITGSYDHAVADGTVMQSFYMQIMYDLENHHQSGILPMEPAPIESAGDSRFVLLSRPDETKQAIGMLNMPDLPYTDLMMVLMQTRSNDPKTGLRSITGTATSNYPRPVNGNKLHAHFAAMENRIGIFQEQYARHKHFIELLNNIKAQLKASYGDDWMKQAGNNYSDTFLSVVRSSDLQLFFQLRDQSRAFIQQEIAMAREDRNMSSKIITMFHGRHMNWKATRLAQRLLRKKLLGNVNGTLLSQMTLDENQARPLGSPDYFFTTITPDRNNAGVTTLRRSIITNREFYRKHISVFVDELDRNPQTLNRTSHVVYVEEKDPAKARQKAIRLAADFQENWILMSTLIDMAA